MFIFPVFQPETWSTNAKKVKMGTVRENAGDNNTVAIFQCAMAAVSIGVHTSAGRVYAMLHYTDAHYTLYNFLFLC